MTAIGLTPRQQDMLVFLRAYRMRTGVCPTFAEIADGLGMKSRGAILRLLRGLEERGHIRRLRGKSRAIEIIDHNRTVATVHVELPPATQAQLNAFCEVHDEDPDKVIADAVALHLDKLESILGREATGS